jgi:adenosylcobinamide hydrolase
MESECANWRNVILPRLENVDQNRQQVLSTDGGEVVSIQDRSLLVSLPPDRSVLSTSWLNGGYREDMEYVINHQVYEGVHGLMGQQDMPEYLSMVAGSLGLKPERVTGLATAASMRNAAITRKDHSGVEVVAIVTAGVETNGGRAGDPAAYHAEIDRSRYTAGTINTILLISAFLPAFVMARAIMTATEAKTCALQQLMAPSKYSNGLATGSGTDMIAVVSDRSSERVLLDAGKHNKLGEMIGASVIDATTRALELQNGLTPSSQMDAMVRLQRYHVTANDVWSAAKSMGFHGTKSRFLESLERTSRRPEVVAQVAALLHTQDEVSWGLIPERAGSDSAKCNLDAFFPNGGGISGGTTWGFESDQGILANLVRFMAAIAKTDSRR